MTSDLRRLRASFCLLALVTMSWLCVALSSSSSSGSKEEREILAKARHLRSLHQTEDAEALLQPLLVREPQNVAALVLLAQLHLDAGDRTQASDLLVRAVSASPNSIDANNALGELLLNDRHFPEAMDRFETVLTVAPRDPAARSGELAAATKLSLSANAEGHPEVALQVLQHARSKLPDDPKLLLDIGAQATDLKLFADAADALHLAIKLSPNAPDILYALAQVEIEQQRMPDAEKDLRAYLAQKPNDASAHFGLGHIYAMLLRVDEAKAEFNRSIELQPVQTESYYQLGQLELTAQHDTAAKSLFLKVLARDPKHGGALAGIGVLAFRAKDYQKAERYLADAERAAPDYGTAHYYRSLALARLGRKDEAEAELHKASELSHKEDDQIHQ